MSFLVATFQRGQETMIPHVLGIALFVTAVYYFTVTPSAGKVVIADPESKTPLVTEARRVPPLLPGTLAALAYVAATISWNRT